MGQEHHGVHVEPFARNDQVARKGELADLFDLDALRQGAARERGSMERIDVDDVRPLRFRRRIQQKMLADQERGKDKSGDPHPALDFHAVGSTPEPARRSRVRRASAVVRFCTTPMQP